MAPVDDIQVGDLVNVPGGMYGTIRFLGSVAGKPGRFAGVELAPEHAPRGKNSGDVDGRQYFRSTIAGAGIFVPMNNSKYVTKRTGGAPPTPMKPANFSKSVGPGASVARPRIQQRPSLHRPESPQTPAPPKLNLNTLRTPSGFSKTIGPSNGGLRSPLKTPSRLSRPSSRVSQVSDTPSAATRLNLEPLRTPPAADHDELAEKVRRLEKQLLDRDKQLDDQASTLTELQEAISELEGSDALQVRAQLRERNEKIAQLTAEFDSHRADFRSTLDTLEVAATETERVYEQRLDELLQANRELQDRGEDVETVARQLKQLEDLVSELEEGLEDARRGEAEARGEVEFLRGEVERAQLELKQEKEKSAAALKDAGVAGDGAGQPAGSRDLDQKDDEIRGLKAIIHSLSRGDLSNPAMGQHAETSSNDTDRVARLESRLQELEELTDRKDRRIEELERDLNQNSPSPQMVRRNRRSTVTVAPLKQHKTDGSTGPNGHGNIVNHTHRLSDRTVVPAEGRETPNGQHPTYSQHRHNLSNGSDRQLETMHESDNRSSDDGSSLWCEICETGGHDILTCTNMFGNGAGRTEKQQDKWGDADQDNHTPAKNSGSEDWHKVESPQSQRTGREAVLEGLKGIGGLTSSMSPVAGKSSGVIDETKWCALCERDGHESIDCPFDE